MKLELHADDIGASPSVTVAILDCYDRGLIGRVSVLVTGAGYAAAVAPCLERPGLVLALHLDLEEGRPLAPAKDIPLLVDSQGHFRRSFAGLWLASLGPDRKALRRQIRTELRAQIDRFQSDFGRDRPLQLDGHRHVHLLPIVFDALLDIAADIPVDRVRITREPAFLAPDDRLFPFGPNLAKHLLLRRLSARCAPELSKRGIDFPDAFLGLLYAGRMSPGAVAAGLERLPSARVVECLFHPGQAHRDEAALWSHCPDFGHYYLSAERGREAASLSAPELRRLVTRLDGQCSR